MRRLDLIDLLRVTVTLPLLAYATYSDVKTRYVSDLLWVAGICMGVVFNVWGLFVGSVGVVDLVGVGLLIGAIFLLDNFTSMGGADKLAVVTVAILNPSLLFAIYYLVTLAIVTCVLSVIIRRRVIPYLPVITVCYLFTLFM